MSEWDAYIEICCKNGISRQVMTDFLDYQTITDFAITNTDRHLNNFGILRDADTLQILGPAPIFDSGNSMFYDTQKNYSRQPYEILTANVNGFFKKEEKFLEKVRNRDIVSIDRLPMEDDVTDFYTSYGIPEEKAQMLAGNYTIKKNMIRSFQIGKKISYYLEKRAASN